MKDMDITPPVVSAAKFTAYRKAHKVFFDLFSRQASAEKRNAQKSEVDQLSDALRVAAKVEQRLGNPISDAIHAAEGRSKARTMLPTLLARQVSEFEAGLRLPKKSMDGMRVRIISAFGFRHAPKSWKHPAMATAAFLTNRRGTWQIDEIRRIDTRGIARKVAVLNLPEAARDKIVENFLADATI